PQLRFGPGIPALKFIHEYGFDTARAITSLVYNGVVRDYPDIRWHFTHCGGTPPSQSARPLPRPSVFAPCNQGPPERPFTYPSRLYCDEAVAFSSAQLQALRTVVPDDHIMFGSDYPACRHLFATDNVKKMPFLEGRVVLPHAGDPEPPAGDVYGPDERIALE